MWCFLPFAHGSIRLLRMNILKSFAWPISFFCFLNVSTPTFSQEQPQSIHFAVKGEEPELTETPKRTLSAEVINQVIRNKLGKLKSCYQNLLAKIKRPPPPQGQVVTTFKISPQGMVVQARIASSDIVAQPDFNNCMLTQIKSCQFPESDTGASEVKYPFAFQAPSEIPNEEEKQATNDKAPDLWPIN